MRVAAVQLSPRLGETHVNQAAIEGFLVRAASQGARLVLFAEVPLAVRSR